MRISLCVICGNEAAHIERMLDSFAPAFDELSIVHAIGASAPDDTLARASAWCEAHGKAYRCGDYANTRDIAFPHVDDFAAARNLSFANATGEWLMWADCDDIASADIATVREIAESGGADMYRFPYEVPDAGKVTQRERLIRSSLFRSGRTWRSPVHETLLIVAGDRVQNRVSPRWIHAPVGPKAGGDKRNLRILTSALRDAPLYYYYVHQEYYHARNLVNARKAGELYLSLPGVAPELAYQCRLNLCEIAETTKEAVGHALHAWWLYQYREAAAALVRCAMQEEDADRVMRWAETMMAIAEPEVGQRLWCHEPRWYGWAGHDLYIRALRLSGRTEYADTWRRQIYHKRERPLISLVHATRGRAEKAFACRDMWLGLASRPERIEHIFAIDSDDAESLRWLRQFEHVVSDGRSCVRAWNIGARASRGGLLVQLSDDWVPPRAWDDQLLSRCSGRDPFAEQFAIAVSDGSRADRLMCMAIMSEARWRAQGCEMFSEEYESVYSDNEYTERAYNDGIVIEARDLVFRHNHPAFGRGADDATYRHNNAQERYERGRQTFLSRNPSS